MNLLGLRVVSLLCAATVVVALSSPAYAVLTYIESGGVVVGEAEIYSNRAGAGPNQWLVVPGESSGAGPAVLNARGGAYIQALPDNNSPGSPLVAPSIDYVMDITTTGTYQLHLRWDGNGNRRGTSNSLFADIVELKDGPSGAIADWYEVTHAVDGDFATPNLWDGDGGREANQSNVNPISQPMLWTINTPGFYTLRFSQREDGANVDAFAFQLSTLPAPAGVGPDVSQITGNDAAVPEPLSAALSSIALGSLVMTATRRRGKG